MTDCSRICVLYFWSMSLDKRRFLLFDIMGNALSVLGVMLEGNVLHCII